MNILNVIVLYWLAGAVYIIIEMALGAAALFVKELKKAILHFNQIFTPIALLVLSVVLLGGLSLAALAWPVFMWTGYRDGDLFCRDKWKKKPD